MIRGALLACTFALVTAISTPNLGSARESESERPDGRSEPTESEQPDERSKQGESERPEGREEWRERLLIANQEVAIALKRSVTALKAYQTMRHRRRPRGDGKQAVMDELELSREALTTAQQDLEKIEKAARRAGASPSWLKFDPAEIKAATQVPASLQP